VRGGRIITIRDYTMKVGKRGKMKKLIDNLIPFSIDVRKFLTP
jgi:hypothetical protein